MIYAGRGFSHAGEVAHIPIADYLGVLILAELIGLWLRLRPRAYAAE